MTTWTDFTQAVGSIATAGIAGAALWFAGNGYRNQRDTNNENLRLLRDQLAQQAAVQQEQSAALELQSKQLLRQLERERRADAEVVRVETRTHTSPDKQQAVVSVVVTNNSPRPIRHVNVKFGANSAVGRVNFDTATASWATAHTYRSSGQLVDLDVLKPEGVASFISADFDAGYAANLPYQVRFTDQHARWEVDPHLIPVEVGLERDQW